MKIDYQLFAKWKVGVALTLLLFFLAPFIFSSFIKSTSAPVLTNEVPDKDYKFDILRDTFNKKKYPQDEFKKIKKYLISKKESDQKRLGNGLVAMIKNYMDRQKLKVNKPSTAKQKHFNKLNLFSLIGILTLKFSFSIKSSFTILSNLDDMNLKNC